MSRTASVNARRSFQSTPREIVSASGWKWRIPDPLGSGSAANPETGKSFDDIKPLLDSIGFLSAKDKANIFEENARQLFPRLQIERAS